SWTPAAARSPNAPNWKWDYSTRKDAFADTYRSQNTSGGFKGQSRLCQLLQRVNASPMWLDIWRSAKPQAIPGKTLPERYTTATCQRPALIKVIASSLKLEKL
ncbi:MAG: hypothetical protein KIS61_32235, partial [Candidatus Eremiobacteraeota bacterium]|nr:hypothetical protein [Candidatus Eremiobacteraeota bacterium]